MNDLRDNFYRALKDKLGIDKIILGRASPLIIQIKKAKDGYYGVILIWKRKETKRLEEILKLKGDEKFNLKEVKP